MWGPQADGQIQPNLWNALMGLASGRTKMLWRLSAVPMANPGVCVVPTTERGKQYYVFVMDSRLPTFGWNTKRAAEKVTQGPQVVATGKTVGSRRRTGDCIFADEGVMERRDYVIELRS